MRHSPYWAAIKALITTKDHSLYGVCPVGVISLITRILRKLTGSGGKYVSSSQSTHQLYHKTGSNCFYMRKILGKNKKHYVRRRDAEEDGLRFCHLCRDETEQSTLREYD
ncbi:MAG: hypothetical protein ABIH11_08220 [Candidatus Altiarchaeota archaeon]